MADMNFLIGIFLVLSIGLIVFSALMPQVDTGINNANLTNTQADATYDLLPLFLVIGMVSILIMGQISLNAFGNF